MWQMHICIGPVLTGSPTSVVTRKLVNRRSVTISPSCKRLRPDLSGAEHVRRSGRYDEMFQRGRKVKEGRRWLMNLRVIALASCQGRIPCTLVMGSFPFKLLLEVRISSAIGVVREVP